MCASEQYVLRASGLEDEAKVANRAMSLWQSIEVSKDTATKMLLTVAAAMAALIVLRR